MIENGPLLLIFIFKYIFFNEWKEYFLNSWTTDICMYILDSQMLTGFLIRMQFKFCLNVFLFRQTDLHTVACVDWLIKWLGNESDSDVTQRSAQTCQTGIIPGWYKKKLLGCSPEAFFPEHICISLNIDSVYQDKVVIGIKQKSTKFPNKM